MRKFLRHFFLPHEKNNHRAKALHPETMLVYVLLLTLFNFGFRYVHKQYPDVLGYATDIRVSELLSLTNQKRAALGLSQLVLNAKLSKAAAGKAQDMFLHNYWAHTSPQGATPWQFIQGANYKYTMAGENLAKNFSNSSGVVEAWMASPTHRDNIVKPGYRDIGFAIVNGVLNGEETTLVVQMFGTTDEKEVAENQKPVAIVPAASTEALGEQAPIEPVVSPIPTIPVAPPPTMVEAKPTIIATLQSVIEKPLVNIPTMTRDIVFIFLGLLIGVLAIDGIVVSRKKIYRTAGHNLAHIMFFIAICLALMIVKRGALL